MKKCEHTITFTTGEETCYADVGEPCRWSGSVCFGTRPVCLLFRDSGGDYMALRDTGRGWLRRCDECIRTYPEVKT